MPTVTNEELHGKHHIDMRDCEKFSQMGDAELDAATIESWKNSPVWAVMSKSIRATLYDQHQLLRDIRVPAEQKQFISGFIRGLEYVHDRLWDAMERKIPDEQRAGGAPSAADNASLLDETMREIQKLEEELK